MGPGGNRRPQPASPGIRGDGHLPDHGGTRKRGEGANVRSPPREHRVRQAEFGGLLSQVGVDPLLDPDTAVLAMLLAAA